MLVYIVAQWQTSHSFPEWPQDDIFCERCRCCVNFQLGVSTPHRSLRSSVGRRTRRQRRLHWPCRVPLSVVSKFQAGMLCHGLNWCMHRGSIYVVLKWATGRILWMGGGSAPWSVRTLTESVLILCTLRAHRPRKDAYIEATCTFWCNPTGSDLRTLFQRLLSNLNTFDEFELPSPHHQRAERGRNARLVVHPFCRPVP